MTAPRILGSDSPRQNPNAPIVGWHFDYQLRIGPLAHGAISAVLDLPIQLGAPFCLRAIGGYNIAADTFLTAPLTNGFIEFTDSQDQWLATDLIGISGDWPSGGNNALYEPVYEQIVYGPNSVIQVRIRNGSAADWHDPRLVFRGTHLYFKDRIYSPSYPRCYTAFPYEFPINLDVSVSSAGQTLRDIPLTPTGADYALRGAVLSLVDDSGSIEDLEIQLKDQSGRPYSNDFIHHKWLFSTDLAERPGIFYPEIYLPKDRILLADFFQGENEDFHIQLSTMGARVFPK